jgi:hypothetical protein
LLTQDLVDHLEDRVRNLLRFRLLTALHHLACRSKQLTRELSDDFGESRLAIGLSFKEIFRVESFLKRGVSHSFFGQNHGTGLYGLF